MIRLLSPLRPLSVGTVKLVSRRLSQQIETGIRQTGSTMANSPCNLPLQTRKSRPPHQTVRRTAAVVSSFRPLLPSTPNRCVSRLHPRIFFFLRKKIPARQKARVGKSTVSLARGANREVKERVKGKASRVQSTRIGSALVCVRRNVQHRELKLSKSTRFALVTVVTIAVPTGCVVSPPLFSKTCSHTKNPPQAIGHRVYHQP